MSQKEKDDILTAALIAVADLQNTIEGHFTRQELATALMNTLALVRRCLDIA